MNAYLILLLLIAACTGTPTGYVVEEAPQPEVIVQSCREVEELVQESYDEPVVTQEQLSYEVIGHSVDRVFDEGATARSEVTIRNTDTAAGEFTIAQTFTTPNGTATYESAALLAPDATHAFTESFTLEYNQEFTVTYTVLAGMKNVESVATRYRTTTVTRTVCD